MVTFRDSLNPQRHFGWEGATPSDYGVAKPDDPSHPDPLYWVMEARRGPVRACMEGTEFLRRNAETYLPKQPMELEDSWRGRVSRSVFSPYFQRVVRTAVGLILRKPVFLEGGDEAYWEEWRLDVDRRGTDLDEFCRGLLTNVLAYGHQSWLVDFPDTSNIRTLRDQNEAQLRPYFLPVLPWDVIGWRQDPREKLGELQQVRIREVTAVPKGKFGQEYKNRVRVLEPSKWELYEAQGERGTTGWELIDSGRISVPAVPLVTCYSNKQDTLYSLPLFEEIAQLNLTHYQRHADLIQCLHVAAQPILVLKGWDDTQDPVGISVNNALLLPPEGDAMFVEPASSAFDAQRAELEALVEEMSGLGIAILSKQKNQAESGLAKALDRADSNAILGVVSKDLEQSLQQAINLAAEYAGIEPPTVVLDRDFDVAQMDGTAMTSVNTLFTSGLIDQKTALEMLKRGEAFGDGVDLDEVLAESEAEQLQTMDQEMQKMEAQAKLKQPPQKPPGK